MGGNRSEDCPGRTCGFRASAALPRETVMETRASCHPVMPLKVLSDRGSEACFGTASCLEVAPAWLVSMSGTLGGPLAGFLNRYMCAARVLAQLCHRLADPCRGLCQLRRSVFLDELISRSCAQGCLRIAVCTHASSILVLTLRFMLAASKTTGCIENDVTASGCPWPLQTLI